VTESPWTKLTLSEAHLARVQESGISPEVAQARGYRTVYTPDDLTALGFSEKQSRLVPALLIPVHGVDGGEPVGYQIRPDKPRKLGEREVKYETPKGQALRLDVPPVVQPRLGDPASALWVTEGARKADAAVSNGLDCVDLAGVWSWRGTNDLGGRLELADFDRVAWNGRDVYLAFDSDVMMKRQVRQALHRLSSALERRSARVHIVVLPSGPHGEKRGLDDMLAAGSSPEDLLQLVQDDFFADDEKVGLDVQLRDFILNAYEPGQDDEGNPFVIPKSGSPIVRMLDGGSPSLDIEAPARFSDTVPSNPVLSLTLIRNVIHQIRGICAGTEPSKLYLRSARLPSGIVLDLGDSSGRVVVVTAKGWAIRDRVDGVLFRRSQAVRPLPTPERGGSLEELRELLNVTDETWPLIMGWVIAAPFSDIARPLLFHQGPQGSAKTDAGVFAANVFDPREELSAFPRKGDRSDLGAVAASSYILGFDNASAVNQELSDWLCSVVTGAADVRRVLHTTSTVQALSFKRTGVITGVTIGAIRPDLAERLVHVPFTILGKADRRDHAVIVDRFNAAHGRILGAALDAVSVVLRHLDEARREGRPAPRMADYSRILRAYDLGAGTQLFEAYVANVETALSDQVDEDPFLGLVRAWVESLGEVEDTAQGLLDGLTRFRSSRDHGDEPDDRYFPRSGRRFSEDLARGEAGLREVDIKVERRRSNGVRLIKLRSAGGQGSKGRNVPISGSPCDPASDLGFSSSVPYASRDASADESKVSEYQEVERDVESAEENNKLQTTVLCDPATLPMLDVTTGLPDGYGADRGGIRAGQRYSGARPTNPAPWRQLDAFGS
jgi:hypothetical protein